jgi:hypothetical protein
MKSVQVRFDIIGNTVEYRCLYIKNELRGNGRVPGAESCTCPELRIEDGECTIFLRGDNPNRDDEVCTVPIREFEMKISRILKALLMFDKEYSKPEDIERYWSIISFNGIEIKFNTEIQEKIIKLLEISV